MHFSLCLSFLLCVSAVTSGADSRISVGVAPFESVGYTSDAVAIQVQGIIESELQSSHRIRLVERSRLADVLAEASFQQSGVTSRGPAAALGEQFNIDYLLFGQLSGRNRKYHLSLKVVSVSTNEVLWTDSDSLGGSYDHIAQRGTAMARRVANIAFALSPIEMIVHMAGEFVMGSTSGTPDETPEHAVHVNAFYLDRTEVSKAAFDLYAHRHGVPTAGKGAPDEPATMVSWSTAYEYCRSRGKRLPTEAEWEYAARGSEGRIYPWGDSDPTRINARFGGGHRGPDAVDRYPGGVSTAGALNLAGNVAEWVSDWWDPTFYERSRRQNPEGPLEGDYKITRGGSWADTDFDLRSSARTFHNPQKGSAFIGFRCARSVSQ